MPCHVPEGGGAVMQKPPEKRTELFERMPVRQAALTLIVPTVLSQLVMLVYNMADTWFIGQTGNPHQVAAVTVTYPVFMMMNAVANLFGIGGSSLISRMLGRGEEKAGETASFSLWAAGLTALFCSIICLVFEDVLLESLGTDAVTMDYAKGYLFWTVIVGGLPTVLNLVLANIIRAQGEAEIASAGMSAGGVLNLFLDPFFIFGLKMGASGAALATCLSNLVSLLFLAGCYIRHRRESLVRITMFPRGIGLNEVREICSIGTPAALQIILAAISNGFLLGLMSSYPVAAISGLGVMQKVESIPFQAIMGISSGILPLVAYNFASGNRERMRQAVRFALMSGLFCSLVFLVLCEAFAPEIVRFFIDDAASVACGAAFVRLRITALPFITAEFMLIAVFQGIGGARQSLFLSLFRKGILDLPLMFLAERLFPMYGVMLVQPFMEMTGCMIALVMYAHVSRENSSKLNDLSGGN